MMVPKWPHRYYIETWGCQMNELDSQRMAGQLMEQGFLPAREPAEADLILLNSCSVREKAAHKAYSRLGQYRKLKEKRPELVIGFCGCVAQQEGEAALQRVPAIDFVIGPGRVGELRELLGRRNGLAPVIAIGFPRERQYDIDSIARDGCHKGMVTIVEGCDRRCTFCVVPSTRGPERCRPIADIFAEVRHLLDHGFVEIELLGQTVNHWREPGGGLDFADLLDLVARLPGLRRLRFVTSYPRDFTPRMVGQLALHQNICPHLHLPVQSGSNHMLKLMGRGYRIEEYCELVEQLRAARPGLALSTDIIVGFPGETEEDFADTVNLVGQLRFASIFAFEYSPRPGTAALRLPVEPVEAETASRRLATLFELQNRIQLEENRELVGREMEVMVTGRGREPDWHTGRTPCHRVVNFRAAAEGATTSRIVPVRIEKAFPHSLSGRASVEVGPEARAG